MHAQQTNYVQHVHCLFCSLFDPTKFVSRQLVAAWVAVVQDYTVLGTHGPLVQAAYTPRLFPAPSLSIIAKLLPNLHSCCPAALTALAATLPQAARTCTPPAVHAEPWSSLRIWTFTCLFVHCAHVHEASSPKSVP